MKDVNILKNNGVNVEESLELFGDMEMYDETLNDFLDMVDEKLANLDKFKAASDMPNYAIEVHSLKSDARYLGFTKLADLCYDSELKSKAGDLMSVQTNHPTIFAEAKRMIGVSQMYLGRPVTVSTQQPAAPVAPQPVMQSAQPMQNMQQPIMSQAQVTPVAPVAPQPVMQSAQPMQNMQQPMMSQAQVTPVAPVAPQPVMQSVQSMQSMQQPIMNQVQESDIPRHDTIEFLPIDNNDADQMFAQPSMPIQNTQLEQSVQKDSTVLVIDDSVMVTNYVRKILDSKYNVIVLNDGAQAINALKEIDLTKVKAILLDLNMPNVNGFEVLDYLKESGIFVKIPVVVESGAEDQESLERARNYPIIDVLSKPFNERDLQRSIEMALATYF